MYKSGEGLLGHVADDSHARDHRISVPGKVGTVGPRVEVLVLFVPHSARRRARHSAGWRYAPTGGCRIALFSLGRRDQLAVTSRVEPLRSDRASAILSSSARHVVCVGVRGTVRCRGSALASDRHRALLDLRGLGIDSLGRGLYRNALCLYRSAQTGKVAFFASLGKPRDSFPWL